MTKRICSVEGCGRPHNARGLCGTHYSRLMKHGDTNLYLRTPEDRFWANVEKSGDCWLWTGGKTGGEWGRYGAFQVNGRQTKTHRFAYELLVGPVPEGLELDHLCRVTLCCNPEHLEAVTHRENLLRGVAPCAVHAKKTHCPQGHPYDKVNTRIYKGMRTCRVCDRARSSKRNYLRYLT